MSDLTGRGLFGRVSGCILVLILVVGMTAKTIGWYRHELGYVGRLWQVVRVSQPVWSRPPPWRTDSHGKVIEVNVVLDPNSWPYDVGSDVTHIFGDYWDVYRMAFLSGGRVVGIPHPSYPNRFRGWSRGLGPEKGKLMVLGLRRERRSQFGHAVHVFYDPKSRTASNWRSPFGTAWLNDGRDPAEVDRIRVILPSLGPAGR